MFICSGQTLDVKVPENTKNIYSVHLSMPYQCSGSDDIKISFYLKRDSQLQVDLNLYARRLSLIQHLSIVKNVHLIVDNVEQLYFTQMTPMQIQHHPQSEQ